MRLRWRWFFPGFPAVLLVPELLALWPAIFSMPQFRLEQDPWGFPLVFVGWRRFRWVLYSHEGPHMMPILLDLALALVAAYIVPMALDRLVFPAIRARQGRKRGTGEAG